MDRNLARALIRVISISQTGYGFARISTIHSTHSVITLERYEGMNTLGGIPKFQSAATWVRSGSVLTIETPSNAASIAAQSRSYSTPIGSLQPFLIKNSSSFSTSFAWNWKESIDDKMETAEDDDKMSVSSESDEKMGVDDGISSVIFAPFTGSFRKN